MKRWVLALALLLAACDHPQAQDADTEHGTASHAEAHEGLPIEVDPAYAPGHGEDPARVIELSGLHQEESHVYVRVVGRLRNVGRAIVTRPKLHLVGLDSAGQVVEDTVRSPGTLKPGEAVPFRFLGSKLARTARVLVHVESREGPVACVASD